MDHSERQFLPVREEMPVEEGFDREIIEPSAGPRLEQPQLVLHNSFEDFFSSQYQAPYFRNSEKAGGFNHSHLIHYLNLNPQGAVVEKWELNKHEWRRRHPDKHRTLFAVKSPYQGAVDVIQLIPDGQAVKSASNQLAAEDIVFVNRESGKTFNLRSLLGREPGIIINPEQQFQADPIGSAKISLPPLGRHNPPRNLIKRKEWDLYKQIEPLVIFHQAAHLKQKFDHTNPAEVAEAENEAWEYAWQVARQLRQEGLDLLPEITDEQMFRSHLGHEALQYSPVKDLKKAVGSILKTIKNHNQ